MGLFDAVVNEGYKPKASTEGIWEPYKGVYKVSWDVCRVEEDEKYGPYIQAEFSILETLKGDQRRESKFADFRNRYYLTGEKGAKNQQKFLDDAFTFGVDIDVTTDEKMQEGFMKLIGQLGYLKAWSWLPKDSDTPRQSFSILQEAVAEKQREAGANPL